MVQNQYKSDFFSRRKFNLSISIYWNSQWAYYFFLFQNLFPTLLEQKPTSPLEKHPFSNFSAHIIGGRRQLIHLSGSRNSHITQASTWPKTVQQSQRASAVRLSLDLLREGSSPSIAGENNFGSPYLKAKSKKINKS